MGLFDFFKKALKPSTSRPEVNFRIVGGQVVYYELDWNTYIEKGYRGNPDVFSIVTDLARRRAEAPIEQYKVKSKKSLSKYRTLQRKGYPVLANQLLKSALGEEVENSDILKLLNKPNKYQSGRQFIEMCSLHYDILGEVIIWVTRGTLPSNEGKPIELHLLPSYDIEPISDGTFRGVSAYRIRSIIKEVPPTDILFWTRQGLKTFDEYLPMRGVSPLEAGAKILQKSNSAEDAAVDSFETRGGRGIVYFDNDDLDISGIDEKKQESRFNEKVYGKNSKSRWLWSNTKMGSLDLSKDAVQLDILNQQKYTTLQLCRLFNYDETLLSSENKTLDNLKVAVRRIIVSAVLPWQTDFAESLANWLAPFFGETEIFLRFDQGYYPELQEDIVSVGPVLEGITFLTDNEKREYLNYEPYVDSESSSMADRLLKKAGLEPIEDIGMIDPNNNTPLL